MRRLLIAGSVVFAALLAIVILKYAPGTSTIIWNISDSGKWLLPLVGVSAILDSVHPCSFSILLITIAFLFGMQMTRGKIIAIGGVYIAGIFAAYLGIGLGLFHVLHIFSVPHFMGKLGAALLILFGVLNLINWLFPSFPLKLSIPAGAHRKMAELMNSVSIPAAFALGLLVGLCQFPCMGGPYLMVIGLLHDSVTYAAGIGYLVLYNTILILPLVAVLYLAANKDVVQKMQEWRRTNLSAVRFWGGVAMIILGILVTYI
ncbi:MAG: cytochrome c biogenesis protein CcdA [Patescibacteria group bacterium]